MRHLIYLAVVVAALVGHGASSASAGVAALRSSDDVNNELLDSTKGTTDSAGIKAETQVAKPLDGLTEERGAEQIKGIANAKIFGKRWNGKAKSFVDDKAAFEKVFSTTKIRDLEKLLEKSPELKQLFMKLSANRQVEIRNLFAGYVQKMPKSKWQHFFMALKIVAGAGFALAVAASVYAMGSQYTMHH